MAFMCSDRIAQAIGQLADDPNDINPVVAIFPVRGGGLSIHQLVELNGLHIAATQFSWDEKPDGDHLMARSMFPRLSNKWVGQGSLPAACFREVAEQYSPAARITHMEVPNPDQLDTIGVYVTSADGERRLDKHRFRPVGYSRNKGMTWERIPYGPGGE